jgi:NitT/TauT family transport system ATP-binding protein
MRTEVEAPVTESLAIGGGIEVSAVGKAFGDVVALDGVSLSVAPGSVVAVAGPSGCGKSTLLSLICGLDEPDSGTVSAPPAALMPQRDALLPWLSALDNAALALRVGGAPRADARAAAHEWFERFGLAGFERARPAALSGGMRQRVAFLRTLLAGTPVLCLDEPFGALDALTRWARARPADAGSPPPGVAGGSARTVLLVTHDVEEALHLADRVIVLGPEPGREGATIRQVVDVPGDRPRDRGSAVLASLRAELLEGLGVGRHLN